MTEACTLRTLGEVRTSDSGKLLFCIVTDGNEPAIVIKPRGTQATYYISLREIQQFLHKIDHFEN